MAELLKGAPVAAALSEKMAADVAALKEQGVTPTLAILRVGQRDDDLSYERGAMKRCEKVGVAVKNVVLPADVDSDTFFATLEDLNEDDSVHGILMFRPLPKQLDGEKARKLLSPAKDVDGCTDGSLAGVFTNTALGFPPCTARAVMEAGLESIGIGKIEDIFAHDGLTKIDHAAGNPACMDALIRFMKTDFDGLCFTNLVDTDSVYGHRNDPKGFAGALEDFDRRLAEMTGLLRDGDLMIITADHGCDPCDISTDHTREFIPILAYTPGMDKSVDLGTRKTFADIAATCAEWLGLKERFEAESFAGALR